ELLASSAEDHSVDACNAQDLLIQMAFHRAPEVRASAVYAMGTLASELTQLGDDSGVLTIVRLAERQMYAALLQAAGDGSPMVRREVAHVIGGCIFATYMAQAVDAVARVVADEVRTEGGGRRSAATAIGGDPLTSDLLFPQLYKTLLELSVDAHPDVALVAREACDVLMQCYAHSRAFFDSEAQLDQALHRLEISRTAAGQPPILGFLRSATGVGDALVGQPPHQPRNPQSRNQQARSTTAEQQRRMSAHTSNFRVPVSPMLGTSRQQQQQQQALAGGGGAPPASHRYTMHGAMSPPSLRDPSDTMSASSQTPPQPPASSLPATPP
ncbi:Target of rapamycin complex 1 subunit kog1, partial [Coemansia aciculifera]